MPGAPQPERAAEWLLRMEAAGPDCPPNEITYNAVIDAFGKARQPAKATEWFGRMRAAGVAPDNITYNMYVSVVVLRFTFTFTLQLVLFLFAFTRSLPHAALRKKALVCHVAALTIWHSLFLFLYYRPAAVFCCSVASTTHRWDF